MQVLGQAMQSVVRAIRCGGQPAGFLYDPYLDVAL